MAVQADELGFDLVFALATWLGKGVYGGEIRLREHSIDSLMTSAAITPITYNVLLTATVHIPYGWHPLHIAKDGAVIDHMSGGRWGINVVTGYRQRESRLFGFEQIPHDQRYAMADEFVTFRSKATNSVRSVVVSCALWVAVLVMGFPSLVRRLTIDSWEKSVPTAAR